jgi:hypothetical protein
MKSLQSDLENKREPFDQVRQFLSEHEFSLGGNWDYEHGYFDKSLDEGHKVWLRLPFEVTDGVIDDSSDNTEAEIKFGTPFVLKHEYNEGNDKEAQVHTFGALVDQFQEPVDPDASIEGKWIDQAKKVLTEVEQSWLH